MKRHKHIVDSLSTFVKNRFSFREPLDLYAFFRDLSLSLAVYQASSHLLHSQGHTCHERMVGQYLPDPLPTLLKLFSHGLEPCEDSQGLGLASFRHVSAHIHPLLCGSVISALF
jgi:hypothetical protein